LRECASAETTANDDPATKNDAKTQACRTKFRSGIRIIPNSVFSGS
jgi:hypothetical protein